VRLTAYRTWPFFVLRRRPRFHLSLCAILLNEAPYVLEWIAFHRLVGIEHFYIYDNGSTDGTVELLRERFPAGLITIIDWPRPAAQVAAYRHAVATFADQTEWCAFIDGDEFLFPATEDSLPPLLEMARHHSGLCAFWLLFGSNGLKTRPPGLCIEAFSRRAGDDFHNHRHPKNIVRLHETAFLSNPHLFDTRRGIIDDQRRIVPFDRKAAFLPMQASHESIRVNHYFTKSADEWALKRARGRATRNAGAPDHIRPESDFALHDRNEVEDLTIQRYVARLKASLASLN
jgi:glycosyltransferase involved in cell wall biosynthesis